MARARGAAQSYAVAAGKQFEVNCVGLQLEGLRQRGVIAHLQHAEPTYRMQRGHLVAVAQGGADWSGLFAGGGLAFAIEVKSTQDTRYRRNQLHDGQIAHMDAAANAGALALLAIEFRSQEKFAGDSLRPPRRFVVPWRRIPWQRAVSAESITADALEAAGWAMVGQAECGMLDPFIRYTGGRWVVR